MIDTWLQPRRVFFLVSVICAGLLGYGLYLQHAIGLEPCPMCVLQRYAYAAIGVIALAAALHGPGRSGTRVYAALMGLATLLGGGVAARQTWLQHNPPQISDCGPGLDFMIESFPLSQALPMIFRGSGDCTKVDWTFLGLSIAEWALIWFAIFLVVAIALWRKNSAIDRTLASRAAFNSR